MAALAAEDRAGARIYAELLSAEGAYVDVRRPARLADPGRAGPLSFWGMARAARRRGAVLVGYRRRGDDWACATAVNPPDKAAPVDWEAVEDLVLICTNA